MILSLWLDCHDPEGRGVAVTGDIGPAVASNIIKSRLFL